MCVCNTCLDCHIEMNLMYVFFHLVKKLPDPKLNGELPVTLLPTLIQEAYKEVIASGYGKFAGRESCRV